MISALKFASIQNVPRHMPSNSLSPIYIRQLMSETRSSGEGTHKSV